MQPGRMPPVFRPTFPSGRGVGGRTLPNQGAAPPPRLPVPMWNPVPTGPGRVEGPGEGSGESTVQTSQGQVMPPQQQQVPTGFMSKLKDPRFAAWLMSVGGAMGQPRQVGQTGWGQAAQALGQGYNTLAMYNEMQRQREMQDRDQTLKEQMTAAGMAKTKSDIELGQKGVELGGKKLEQEERLTMAQVKARDEQLTRELLSRKEMSQEELRNDKAKWESSAQVARDKLKQDSADSAAKRTLDEAELKLKAIDIANRGAYYKVQGQADLTNAGANAARSAGAANLDKAQAESITKGTGKSGTAGSSLNQAERREQRRFKAISEIRANPVYHDLPTDEVYKLADEIVGYAERGDAQDNPTAKFTEDDVVKGPDGNLYIIKGGKPVPYKDGQKATSSAAPTKSPTGPDGPKLRVAPTTRKPKIFPNE